MEATSHLKNAFHCVRPQEPFTSNTIIQRGGIKLTPLERQGTWFLFPGMIVHDFKPHGPKIYEF